MARRPADRLLERYAKEYFEEVTERNPIASTYMGLHRYDHLLPDGRKRRFVADIALEKKSLDLFDDLPEAALSPPNRIERRLALYQLRLTLFQDEILRSWEKYPDAPENVGNALFPLLQRDFAPLAKRLASVTARLEAAPAFLDQSKERATAPVALWVQMAVDSAEGLPPLFQQILGVGKEKLPPRDASRLAEAIAKCTASLEKTVKWLKNDLLPRASPVCTIGPKNFAEMVELRELGMTPAKILSLGTSYLKKTKSEMVKYAALIAPGKTLDEVRAMVDADRPATFEEALQEYRKCVRESRQFVAKSGYATVPPGERLDVIETPAFLRPTLPFAAYFAPGKFEKQQVGIYVVSRPEGGDTKTNARPKIANTTVHEGYPGHHLQLVWANKHPSLIRALLMAPEFAEGWAHYCEQRMKEVGYDDTPTSRFVMAMDLVWRAARVVVDVQMHTDQMTFEQAVTFMTEQAGMPAWAARVECQRYTQSPTYPMSYLLGKHMILELREKIAGEMGRKFTDRFFHDSLLANGTLPFRYHRMIIEQARAKPFVIPPAKPKAGQPSTPGSGQGPGSRKR